MDQATWATSPDRTAKQKLENPFKRTISLNHLKNAKRFEEGKKVSIDIYFWRKQDSTWEAGAGEIGEVGDR